MKQFVLSAAFIMLATAMSAKTIQLGNTATFLSSEQSIPSLPPEFDISVSPDSTSVTFSVKIPTVDIEIDKELYPNTYWWHVSNFFPSTTDGVASLPQRSLAFQLPGNADNIILTENYAHWQSIGNYPPTPARPPLLLKTETPYSVNNVPPVSHYSPINSPVAEISCISRQRSSKIAYVHLQPFKYTGEGADVAVCHEFSYTLSFDKSENADIIRSRAQVAPIFPRNDSITIVDPWWKNDSSLWNNPITADNTDRMNIANCCKYRRPSNYLILTTPTLYSTVKEYAEWKKMLGHNVTILATEKWSRDLIKSTIKSCYQIDNALHYILFAGSITEIPAALDDFKSFNPMGPNYTDFPYTVLDSVYTHDNCNRSFYSGRLLADNVGQMSNITNKLRNIYKLGAYSPSYHKQAAHVSYFDIYDNLSDIYTERNTFMVATSENIYEQAAKQKKLISRIYYKHKHAEPKFMKGLDWQIYPLPENLVYPDFKWDADSSDIMGAFRKGVHYIYTFAHGSYSCWADRPNWYRPIFDTRLISGLHNPDKLPYVFSISCKTGSFTDPNGLAKNLLSSRFGAWGAIASTANLWCDQASHFAIGLFKTIWPDHRDWINDNNPDGTINLDPKRFAYDNIRKQYVDEEWYTMGNLMDLGMRYTYLTNGRDYIPWELKESTHIYGDPGIFFNTDTPKPIENVHFNFTNEFRIQNSKLIAIPIVAVSLDSCAVVGIYNETTQEVYRYYSSWVHVPAKRSDKLHVVITQHNRLPLEFHVENNIITASGPYISDTKKSPELRLESVKQTSPNSIDVTYNFDQSECSEYNATISVKDMNNNIIAQECVRDQYGTISISSPDLRNGIYIVSIQSPIHSPSQQKILIR